MQKEIHINGDVAWMLDQAVALGLADPNQAKQVRQAVASYYEKRAVRNGTVYELKDVVSADENHTGNNDLYTNLLAQWASRSKIAYKLPRDNETYLTYDNDSLRSYKQAAAVLAIYPLQMIDVNEARKMMERFSSKVTANGPAMSHSVHATIWARLGESEKAYEEWRKSWQRYTKHPLMLFSEKERKDTTYFTTGAAGCLQTVIYGFLGFGIDYKKENMAAWSMPLNDKWLSIRPRLPAAWKSVKFTNFVIKGRRYTLTIDAQGAKVNQGEP
jgi:trehalose/maltose hydrolase-like predicted phosphorylase